jgi:iron only hydrogenase large subunit-like protein
MTGGRLKRIADHLKNEEAFCLTYGDGVSDVNITDLIAFHKSQKVKATLTATLPPGGCVGGGGQPYGATNELRTARAKGLYDEDSGMTVRCSHHNTMVKKAYDEYLGKPLSDKAHHLLHTHYEKRKTYKR